MKQDDIYSIRLMTKNELSNIAIEWAAQESWNPGLYDATAFYNTDKEGFFVGLLNKEIISCISAVSYNKDFGFIGFYIVKPEYRAKGYGLKIWKTALQYLNTQNIGLDGVIEQQTNYKKSSFKFAYSNIRYKGYSKKHNDIYCNIIPYNNSYFEDLFKYDCLYFPVPRLNFFKHWIEMPESKCFVAIENDKIKGYSVIRKCRSGYKIGPLFAESHRIAKELFKTLNNSLEFGTEFYLDAPEINSEAIILAEDNSMVKVFETARMYTKKAPAIDSNKIFGVTTFELG